MQTIPASRVVLNAGSGVSDAQRLQRLFGDDGWREIRLDIDPRVHPDIIGSVTELDRLCAPASLDAVWSSHNLEHLYEHEIPDALSGFHRALKPDGFVLVTCPDLEAVAAALVAHGPDHVAYTAPAGPIRVHDMLFGHGPSIATGFSAMAHRSGFTQASLGQAALAAGFGEVRVGRGSHFDLWAVFPMPDCAFSDLKRLCDGSEFAFLFSDPAAPA